MDFDTVRPIISGLVGATIAGWLAIKWAGRLPSSKHPAKQRELVDQQRTILRCANFGAGIGIGSGLILYFGGFLSRYDWRGLGVAAGLMALLPVVVIVAGNLRGGLRSIRNGFLAYAIDQKTPVFLLYFLMTLMVAGGVWAGLAFRPDTTNNKQNKSEMATPRKPSD